MRDLANPKSQIFIVQSLLSKRFEGFKSRWMISAECRNLMPFASWYMINLLWASFSIFWLNNQIYTLWHCEDPPPWIKTRGRDPYHFRPLSPGGASQCSDDLAPAAELFIWTSFARQSSAEKHRIFFLEQVFLLIFYQWFSKHAHRLHFLLFLIGCIFSIYVVKLIMSSSFQFSNVF